LSPLTWAALGAAALLAPAASRSARRAEALAGRGRLGTRERPDSGTGGPSPGWSGGSGVLATLGALALVVAVGTVGAVAGPALAATAAVAVATAGWLGSRAARRRARVRQRDQLTAAIALVAAELDAGAAPAAALDAAAELAPAHAALLRAAAGRIRTGEDPDLTGAGAVGDQLAALGHAWRLAGTAGVPLAQVCRRVAADLAATREQRQAVASGLAGARSSAALLAGLPALGLALGTAMQADPVRVLVATPSGQAVCLLGVCLDAAGLFWTHWLTARAEGP
jgi:tight adherence protein B